MQLYTNHAFCGFGFTYSANRQINPFLGLWIDLHHRDMTVAAVPFCRAASCRLLYSQMTVPFLSHFNTRLLCLSYLRLNCSP